MTATVTGSAQRGVAPEAATWRAVAVETGDDPRAAFDRCSTRLNALVERLASLGEVTTKGVVVEPLYEEEEGGATGVEAIGTVRVRTAVERAAEVAQAAMAAGADRLRGPDFEFEHAGEVHRELLGEAVADARAKAETLAAAAGRRLGRIDEIQEAGSGHVPLARFEMGGTVAMAAAGPPEPPDVRPRELTITASVRVVFALED